MKSERQLNRRTVGRSRSDGENDAAAHQKRNTGRSCSHGDNDADVHQLVVLVVQKKTIQLRKRKRRTVGCSRSLGENDADMYPRNK